MLKSKIVHNHLESLVKLPETKSSRGGPKTFAVSLVSTQNGAPLLSSFSTQEELELSFKHQNSIYTEFLDQFTSIDFNKVYPETTSVVEFEAQKAPSYGTIKASEYTLKDTKKKLSPDSFTDSESVLKLLSIYTFNCYTAFKNDYIHYKNLNTAEKVANNEELKWFCLEVDNKFLFLHLITSKQGEQYFVFMVTTNNYPKHLAKMKMANLAESLGGSNM